MGTVASSSTIADTGGLSTAIERVRSARLAWAPDGTLLTAADCTTARGIPPAALPELVARGELFSLEDEGAPGSS